MDSTNSLEKSEIEPAKASDNVTPVATPGVDPNELYERIVDMIRTIYDPEIPVNIYEIGLIYHIDIDPSNAVNIRMTLTSPACPAAGTLPGEVEDKVSRIEGVNGARVEVVWDPVWAPAMMSEAAKLQLGMF
jgi:FeS assembly SUF system protein